MTTLRLGQMTDSRWPWGKPSRATSVAAAERMMVKIKNKK